MHHLSLMLGLEDIMNCMVRKRGWLCFTPILDVAAMLLMVVTALWQSDRMVAVSKLVGTSCYGQEFHLVGAVGVKSFSMFDPDGRDAGVHPVRVGAGDDYAGVAFM